MIARLAADTATGSLMSSLQGSVDANGAAAALQGRTIAELETLECHWQWLGASSSEAELQDKQRALMHFEIMGHNLWHEE